VTAEILKPQRPRRPQRTLRGPLLATLGSHKSQTQGPLQAGRIPPRAQNRWRYLVCAVSAVFAVSWNAAPAVAQSRWFGPADDVPAISIRPFLTISDERFTAANTFEAVFGQSTAPFWGGGVQVVVLSGRVYAELGASRILRKNAELVGERVFRKEGATFHLGIPLRSTITPFEFTAGYRFNVWHALVPYVGAGVGSYHYTEESDFSDPSENLDVKHNGFVFQTGAEYRAHSWVRIAGDVRFTRVPGILGTGGVSQVLATEGGTGVQPSHEKDLGGWTVGLKVAVGR
jgi:hypothetical protein